MKRRHIRNRIIMSLTLILGSVYLIADSELYYYGESWHNICRKSLPLELEPDRWRRYNNDSLMYCFDIIGGIYEGSVYTFKSDSIIVDKIIKYGFNKEKLIILVKDAKGDLRFIECSADTLDEYSWSVHSNILEQEATISMEDYTWIEVRKDEMRIADLYEIRMLCILIYITLMPIILIGTYILRKAKEIEQK